MSEEERDDDKDVEESRKEINTRDGGDREEESAEKKGVEEKKTFSKVLGSVFNFLGLKGILIIVVALLLVFGSFKFKDYFASKLTIESKATTLGFRDIGELATQSAYVTVVGNETKNSRLPFDRQHIIYSYDVVIKEGYDLGILNTKLKRKIR